jgi:hypothetical protein
VSTNKPNTPNNTQSEEARAAAMKKFPLGNVYMTRGVASEAADNVAFDIFVRRSLRRYASGDWGEMCASDKALNESAVNNPDGGRIFAAYASGAYKIWIITEADRSITTVLFPDEY